jgi:hypothetical protein
LQPQGTTVIIKDSLKKILSILIIRDISFQKWRNKKPLRSFTAAEGQLKIKVINH